MGSSQVSSEPLCPSPVSWIGERECHERLMCQEKHKERSLSNHCHGKNRLNLGKLIYYKTNQCKVRRNKIKF